MFNFIDDEFVEAFLVFSMPIWLPALLAGLALLITSLPGF